jgi:hypothetical protein
MASTSFDRFDLEIGDEIDEERLFVFQSDSCSTVR